MGNFLDSLFIDVSNRDIVPDNGNGIIMLFFLAGVYGYVLFFAADQIGDGSELMLVVPSIRGLVGSIIIPILGAVPDGAIMLFSGLGADAQEKLNVGVGALAGSTIMLISLSWFVGVLAGRVDQDEHGVPIYKKKHLDDHEHELQEIPAATSSSPPRPSGFLAKLKNEIFNKGVTATHEVRTGVMWMWGTMLGLLIIQIPAFVSGCGFQSAQIADGAKRRLQYWIQQPHQTCDPEDERWWALGGAVYCAIAFIVYMLYMYKIALNGENKVLEEKTIKQEMSGIRAGSLSFLGIIKDYHKRKGFLDDHELRHSIDSTVGSNDDRVLKTAKGEVMDPHIEKMLYKFFQRYDQNHDKAISMTELKLLLNDILGPDVYPSDSIFADLKSKLDCNQNGDVDFREFAQTIPKWMIDNEDKLDSESTNKAIVLASSGAIRKETTDPQGVRNEFKRMGSQAGLSGGTYGGVDNDDAEAEDDEDGDSDEDIPDEWKDLPQDERMWLAKKESLRMMSLGTVLVLLFSDPMVNIFNELGKRTGIPVFYISFALAPLASNASELVSTYHHAEKKSQKKMTIALQLLEGAACMNNTFCLCIFLILIYCKKLVWEFSAECIVIIAAQLAVGIVALGGPSGLCSSLSQDTHMSVFSGICVMLVYPLSLGLCYALENGVGLN